MQEVKKQLLRSEDAVETIGGLTAMISYVNDVASDADMKQMRDPLGFTLNAIGHEVSLARRAFGRARRRLRLISARRRR